MEKAASAPVQIDSWRRVREEFANFVKRNSKHE